MPRDSQGFTNTSYKQIFKQLYSEQPFCSIKHSKQLPDLFRQIINNHRSKMAEEKGILATTPQRTTAVLHVHFSSALTVLCGQSGEIPQYSRAQKLDRNIKCSKPMLRERKGTRQSAALDILQLHFSKKRNIPLTTNVPKPYSVTVCHSPWFAEQV